jgi:hypothetical protein
LTTGGEHRADLKTEVRMSEAEKRASQEKIQGLTVS